jgi:sterol desaturase/sphingolipid hydroxylase (fatty acid hydroxylase superfamily)
MITGVVTRSLLNGFFTAGTFIVIGIAVESLYRRFLAPELAFPPHQNRLLNLKCTATILVFRSTVEVVYLVGLLLLIDRFAHPLFHARPGVPFAIFLALIASIVGDFFYYWLHRWMHTSRWLWPIHELHHEDEHVNVTTAFRFHWLESLGVRTAAVIPLLFLPVPMLTIPLLYLVTNAGNAFFVHTAIPFNLGPFTRLVANPQTHRIHHSTLPEHFNKNFAAAWPFWDMLFGTYFHPEKNSYPPTGLTSGQISSSLYDAMLKPLTVSRSEGKSA